MAWVVGARGLLGSAVREAFARESDVTLFDGEPIPWGAPERDDVIAREAARFQQRTAGGPWRALWCAGTGVVGQSQEALARETAALSHWLNSIAALRAPGVVFLASSGGGVYGASADSPLTEDSPCVPVSEYGRAKVEQEARFASWAARKKDVSTLVGRISNLYGPGQNLAKPQGLISHVSRCLIHRRPVHVYVPLDTSRDYLFAPDCAAYIAGAIRRLESSATATHVVKIFASETDTTVGGVLSTFNRVGHRRVHVVSGLQPHRNQQPGHLQFRSSVWRDVSTPPARPLLAGIHQVYQHQLALFEAGRLPPP